MHSKYSRRYDSYDTAVTAMILVFQMFSDGHLRHEPDPSRRHGRAYHTAAVDYSYYGSAGSTYQ